MLIEKWRKFKGWSVLEFFLKEDRKIHLKGLAKEMKISPRTSQIYLHFYEKQGIVNKEKIGNMALYSLDTNPLTFQLKKFYFLAQIYPHTKKFIEKNPGINTLALYGSHASGEYDKKSDIDLLVISQNKKLNLEQIKIIEAEFDKEVKIQIFSIGEWKGLTKKDAFAFSILKNHIVLYGASL